MFCSGGTIANLTALWIARNRVFPARGSFKGIHKSGLHAALTEYGYTGVAVIGSELMHYSLKKAVDILGLGEDALVTIPVDADFRIRVDLVNEKIKECQERKICVMAIIGIAATTERYSNLSC